MLLEGFARSYSSGSFVRDDLTVFAEIFKAMQLMEEKNIRHIPIFDSESLLGMLSVKDVMATLMSDRDTELNHMTDYVNVTY